MFKFFNKFLTISKFVFFKKHFHVTFIHLVHLLANKHSCMVFKHLQDLFDPMDLTNDFPHLFLVCSYVVARCIFKSITKALGAVRMLILGKPFGGIQPIIVGQKNYQLVNNFVFLPIS